MLLTGKVGDGQGDASGWLRDPLFARLLGPFYPGSLNVFIQGVHSYAPKQNYPDPAYIRGQGYLAVRSCKVNGVDGFILRNEHPGPTFPHRRPPPVEAPHTMFEIVARSFVPAVGYASDATVEFDSGPEHLRRLPVVE